MRRDWLIVVVIWAALTAIMEYVIFTWSMLPEGYAREAEIVNEAYVLLLAMGAPVFGFMLAMLGYSAVRFRGTGDPTEDGPPMAGSRRVIGAWLAITSALTLAVLINPGFVGLADIRGTSSADMVVEMEGQRWTWKATYENGAVSNDELVLPVHSRIRFDVTSTDVLHSFWIPGFAMKIDAVPGRTTEMFVTTERLGDYADDFNVRVQCAELCGLSHGDMAMPVRVVEQAEFDAWLAELSTTEAASGDGS